MHVSKCTSTQWCSDTVKLPKHFYFHLLRLPKMRSSPTAFPRWVLTRQWHMYSLLYVYRKMNVAFTCTSLKKHWHGSDQTSTCKKIFHELAQFSKSQQHTTAVNIAISFIHIDRNKNKWTWAQGQEKRKRKKSWPTLYILSLHLIL